MLIMFLVFVCGCIGKKFAVSSGAKCVSVCYYQEAENWWVSKIIKRHKSTYVEINRGLVTELLQKLGTK